MRTAVFHVTIEAVADASEGRIKEAVIKAMREQLITVPGMGIATTEDGKRVRVRQIDLTLEEGWQS